MSQDRLSPVWTRLTDRRQFQFCIDNYSALCTSILSHIKRRHFFCKLFNDINHKLYIHSGYSSKRVMQHFWSRNILFRYSYHSEYVNWSDFVEVEADVFSQLWKNQCIYFYLLVIFRNKWFNKSVTSTIHRTIFHCQIVKLPTPTKWSNQQESLWSSLTL